MKKKSLFLILLLSAPAILFGQYLLRGQVLDKDTRGGIPFANVYFEGTSSGTSADVDGYYELQVAQIGSQLSASAIGYEAQSQQLDSSLAEQTIDFYLSSPGLTLDEIVVVAGENPANAIVRSIIDNKPDNRMSGRSAYAYESYAKIELDLENINSKMQGSRFLKPFAFAFENIDSTSDEKPFLPVYINEVLADVLYTKEGGKAKRVVKAQRATGTKNQTVIDYIKRIHQEFSLYDDWIYVLDKPFASPFSKSALSYYEYYIIDSALVNGHESYRLKFKPKRKQEPTFYGDFWVTASNFAVQRADLRMSPDVNVNLVSRIIIYEEYEPQADGYWVPVKKKMVVDFTPSEKAPGMIARRTETFKDMRIGQPGIRQAYIEADGFYRLEQVEVDQDSFWQDARHEPLSETEQSIYAVVDSIQNVPLFKTYTEIVEVLFVGYLKLGLVEVGPYSSIYSFNPVEGQRFRLGARTTDEFKKDLRFGGFLAYGTADEEFKYGANAEWMISRQPRVLAGAAYTKDISLNSESSEAFVQGDLFSGLLRLDLLQKLIQVQETKAYYERHWKNGFSNRFTLLQREMDPYGSIFADGRGFNYAYLPNPNTLSDVDTVIRSTELILKLRYAPDEIVVDGDYSRTSFGSKKPIVELRYTLGVDGLLGGRYTYHKLDLSYRHYFYLNPAGWLSYRINLGKTFGTVPFLLMEVHPGNEGYFVGTNLFNMMTRYEFASDTYASVMLQHHFDGFFFNRVPLLRKLNLRSYGSFRAVIGSISRSNLEANRLNAFTPDDADTYLGFRTPSQRPYMEAGVGIENILKLFQIEAVWRLSYLDNPQASRFGIRFGLAFYF